MSTAAKIALDKQKHPERYCPTPRCLWRTNGGHCPRHRAAQPAAVVTVMEWIRAGCQLPKKARP